MGYRWRVKSQGSRGWKVIGYRLWVIENRWFKVQGSKFKEHSSFIFHLRAQPVLKMSFVIHHSSFIIPLRAQPVNKTTFRSAHRDAWSFKNIKLSTFRSSLLAWHFKNYAHRAWLEICEICVTLSFIYGRSPCWICQMTDKIKKSKPSRAHARARPPPHTPNTIIQNHLSTVNLWVDEEKNTRVMRRTNSYRIYMPLIVNDRIYLIVAPNLSATYIIKNLGALHGNTFVRRQNSRSRLKNVIDFSTILG